MPEKNGTGTRRSGRATLRVPLKIYERGSDKPLLVEEAYAVRLSLWGGLIAFETAVERDQKLFVFNQATGEIAESRIVYLRPMQLDGRHRLAAIEFLRPSPGFWGVDFPKCDPCQSRATGPTSRAGLAQRSNGV
jgi:hypothetical protein